MNYYKESGTSSSFDITRRKCRAFDCLGNYCETQNDCGDSTYCCRSDRCVARGCMFWLYFGLRLFSRCLLYPSDQTVCADKCSGLDCNSNADCAIGSGECCRDGKCVGALSCSFTSCKSHSGCDPGTYCCKKEKYLLGKGRCRVTCEDKDCDFDEDCGPPNECCIAGKCAKDGCLEYPDDFDCSSPPDESSPPWRVAVIVTAVSVSYCCRRILVLVL